MPDQMGLSGADGVAVMEANSGSGLELAMSQEVRALEHFV